MQAARTLILAAALVAPSALMGQEISVFGLAGSRELSSFGRQQGGGVAIAGFTSASGTQIGLRGAFSLLQADSEGEVFAPPCPSPGCSPSALGRARISAGQLALLVRPHHTSTSRFDVGAGANVFGVQGGDWIEWGLLATVGFARRIYGPAWLSISYDVHGQIQFVEVSDGPNTNYATHLLRVGFSFDLHNRN